MIQIMRGSFADFHQSKHFWEIVTAYGDECGLDGMPPTKPDIDLYYKMDASGMMTTLLALDGDDIVGFLLLLVSPNPHYSVPLATFESIYVRPAHRISPAGALLIKKAEAIAEEKGCNAMVVTAAVDSKFNKLMSLHPMYRVSHNVHFRSLA